MRNLLYWLLWRLFGVRSVVLIDYDGELSLRMARRLGQRFYARRVGFGLANITLLPGGRTEGPSYVRGWEPAYPAGPPAGLNQFNKHEPAP